MVRKAEDDKLRFGGLRQRRFNDIHLEIRLTTLSSCAMEVVNEFGEKDRPIQGAAEKNNPLQKLRFLENR